MAKIDCFHMSQFDEKTTIMKKKILMFSVITFPLEKDLECHISISWIFLDFFFAKNNQTVNKEGVY